MKKDNLQYHLLMGLLKPLAWLPLRVLYLFSDLAYLLVYRVIGYRRKLVRSNLQRVYPQTSERELVKIEKRFYRHFCDTFIEAVKLLHISDAEVDRRIEVVNADLVNKSIAAGRPVVLFLGHYGNWEWVTAITRHLDRKEIVSQIYHPLSNKAVDRLMLKIRHRFGNESIPMAKAPRQLLGICRNGEQFICGFISDQRPRRPWHNWDTLLGIPTPYINGGETIANHVNATMIYVDMEKLSRGRYRITFLPMEPINDGKPNPYTRRYLRLLETSIHRDPALWLWTHNRFRN